MLTLTEKEIFIFKSMIGSRITSCASDSLTIYPTHVMSLNRRLMLSWRNKTLHMSMLLKADFFENVDGFTFYDYTITYPTDSIGYENALVMLDTSPIKKITVYGREIDWQDFDNVHLINGYRSIYQTDDLFHFQCENEQLLLAFDPFFPQTQLVYGLKEIRQFFHAYSHSYKIHYEFE